MALEIFRLGLIIVMALGLMFVCGIAYWMLRLEVQENRATRETQRIFYGE